MLIKPIGAIDPFWAADDGAQGGEGQAPAEAGQAVAEPSGTTPPAEPGGQVAVQAPAAEAGQVIGNEGSAPEPQPPFFEYEWEDGHKDSFSTGDDLRNAWREGTLRRDKFTQETQKLSDRENTLKADQSKYDAEYTQFLQSKTKQDEMASALDQLSEPEFRQLMNSVTKGRAGQQGQAAIPKEILDEIAEGRQFRQDTQDNTRKQQNAEKRDSVYGQLGKELGEGFNSQAVQTEIDRLKNVAPEEQMRAFALLVHHSLTGQSKPIDLARQAQAAAKGQGSIPTPASGNPPAPAGNHSGALTEAEADGMSMQEITARAKKQFVGAK